MLNFTLENRAVEAMPTQFKRWHLQPQYQQQQQQHQQYYPQGGNPQAAHLNMPPPGAQGNPNMPPMNQQMNYNPHGGNFPYNPQGHQGAPGGPQQGGYMPSYQGGPQGGHLNRFQNQQQQQQQQQQPILYDPLQKRDRPYQQVKQILRIFIN